MLFSAQNHNGKVTASDASGTEHSMRIEYGDFGKENKTRWSIARAVYKIDVV